MFENTSVQEIVYQWEREAGLDRPRLPVIPEDEESLRRVRFIAEEFRELCDGFDKDDLEEIADALGDLVWVVYGTAHACGIDLDRVIREIAHSNYSKFPPQRDERGKLVKGPNFVKPNIQAVLETQDEL